MASNLLLGRFMKTLNGFLGIIATGFLILGNNVLAKGKVFRLEESLIDPSNLTSDKSIKQFSHRFKKLPQERKEKLLEGKVYCNEHR